MPREFLLSPKHRTIFFKNFLFLLESAVGKEALSLLLLNMLQIVMTTEANEKMLFQQQKDRFDELYQKDKEVRG